MGCRINGLSHEGTYIHKANATQWGQSLYEGALDFLNFERYFLTFPACFQIPIIFSNLNPNCSDLLDMKNFQKQVKKAFC